MRVLQTKLKHADYQAMAKESLQLAVHFLFHTYLHTKKKLRYKHIFTPTDINIIPRDLPHYVLMVVLVFLWLSLFLSLSHAIVLLISCRVDTEEWMATVEVLLSKSSEACQWMVQYLVGPEGREITRSVLVAQLLNPHSCLLPDVICDTICGECKLNEEMISIYFSNNYNTLT